MTVTNATLESSLFSGNGVTTVFATGFQFDDEADIQVILRASDGTETVQTLTTHYTVSGAGNPSGGSVTMLTPPASGQRLRIVRNLAYTQEVDYTEGTAFPAETHEGALDTVVQQVQQLAQDLRRAPRLPVTSANYPAVFPDGGASKAGHLVRWNSTNGSTLETVSPTDAALGVTTTPYIQTLLDDASASEARTTLGLGSLATQSGTFSGTSSGTNTGDQNVFTTIAVSGQDDVVADSTSDTLTLVAGSNVTLTTNAAGDSITIAATGGGGGGGLSNVVDDLTPQLGGDLDLNGNQITSPDGTDQIDIPNGTIDLKTNSTSRADITDSGLRLGGANARVTTILDEDTMSSNSATALATQQSIKAYVDANISSGAWTKISSQTASNSATIDFTGLSNSYGTLAIEVNGILPVTNSTSLYVRTSTDNGASYDSGASNYAWVTLSYRVGGPTTSGDGSNGSSQISLNHSTDGLFSNTSPTGLSSLLLYITNPNDTGYSNMRWQLNGATSAGNTSIITGGGRRLSTTPINAIRFFFSSGNISTGTFTLYGLEA